MITLPATVLAERRGLEMSGLKMMWLELDGQLVCRWVDERETAETVLRGLKGDLDAAEADRPSLAVGKAA
jgi:hypothetical protein